MTERPANADRPRAFGTAELTALTACVMAMGALSVDLMLPALSDISASFQLSDPNDRQLVLIVYLVGLGAGQLVFGPLVDRYGRKPILFGCVGVYLMGTLGCVLAPTFEALLVARALQSIGAAGARVSAGALVRDLTSGRRMARVMSLAGTIFLAAPIIAPTLGQLILFVAPWRGLFIVLAVFGAILGTWILLRVPETLAPEHSQPLGGAAVARSLLGAMKPAVSRGYSAALALAMGGLFGFISSAEQLFTHTFNLGPSFTLLFALTAASTAVATLLNAAFVERWGMRRLSHAALVGFVCTNLVHALAITAGVHSLVLFTAMIALSMFQLGFLGGNFQALAMEPLGRIAGSASAMVGFVSTLGGAVIGGVIGQLYDGTAAPLIWGMTTVGAGALAIVLITERGRLFGAGDHRVVHHTPPSDSA